jgi:hypothetical protein
MSHIFGKLSFRQKVRSSNCPFDKMSVRQNVRRHTVRSANCLFGKLSFGKMSGYRLTGNYNIFFQMAPYHIPVINNNIAKFGYDSMQQITKKYNLSPRTFEVKFLTCNMFVFYKNLLCPLRSSCLRHNINSGVKCK